MSIVRTHRSEPRSVGSAIAYWIAALAHDHRTCLQVTMKVEDQLALIIGKLDEQTKGINEGNHRINDVQASIEDLQAVKADFDRWRPQVDGKVVDLSSGFDSLRAQVDALWQNHLI